MRRQGWACPPSTFYPDALGPPLSRQRLVSSCMIHDINFSEQAGYSVVNGKLRES